MKEFTITMDGHEYTVKSTAEGNLSTITVHNPNVYHTSSTMFLNHNTESAWVETTIVEDNSPIVVMSDAPYFEFKSQEISDIGRWIASTQFH